MFLKFTCMLHKLKAFTSFHPMKTCRCFDVLIHYFFLPFFFFLDFMILSLRALGNVICFLVSILFTLLLFLLLHWWSAFSRSIRSFTHWHDSSPIYVFKLILRYQTDVSWSIRCAGTIFIFPATVRLSPSPSNGYTQC